MLDFNKFCRGEGKLAVITGAGSGIGAGISMFFADAGWMVVALDMNLDSAKETVAKIKLAGNNAIYLKCDVTNIENCKDVIGEVVLKYGHIDALVNCAGVARRKTVPDCTEWDWDISVDTMLKGVFLMCKFVIPQMKKQGHGKIVNIGSGWSLKGGAEAAPYCAAKGGVWILTRAMAIDHGPDNININCICPGDINTNMLRDECNQTAGGDYAAYLKECADPRPMSKVGEPIDIAMSALFLCSGLAPWVTGSSLVVDGGGCA